MPNNMNKTIPAITPDVMKAIGENEKGIMAHRMELISSILKDRPTLSVSDAATMIDGAAAEASNKGWIGCC